MLDDVSISKKHVRIYSVIYDLTVDNMEVFVYAEDLSTNGSAWLPNIEGSQKRFSIRKNRAFLLSDGDKILLCDGTSFMFVSRACPGELDEIQEMEKDVSCFLR